MVEPDESGKIIPDSHPNEGITLVLSDLVGLYGRGDFDPAQLAQKRGETAPSQKFRFDAARSMRAYDNLEATRGRGVSAVKVDYFGVLCRSKGLFSPSVYSQSGPAIEEL